MTRGMCLIHQVNSFLLFFSVPTFRQIYFCCCRFLKHHNSTKLVKNRSRTAVSFGCRPFKSRGYQQQPRARNPNYHASVHVCTHFVRARNRIPFRFNCFVSIAFGLHLTHCFGPMFLKIAFFVCFRFVQFISSGGALGKF